MSGGPILMPPASTPSSAPAPPSAPTPPPDRPSKIRKSRIDTIETHPQRAEIDEAILKRTMKVQELITAYNLPGPWTVVRRRAKLKRNARRLLRNRVRNAHQAAKQTIYKQEERRANRTIELLTWPLEAAREGFELAKEQKDLPTGADFIDKYMGAVRVFGELTGELGTPGQVNVDARSLHLMALPRADDTPEELALAARLGLPGAAETEHHAEVVDALIANGDDDDEDDDGDEDPLGPDEDDE